MIVSKINSQMCSSYSAQRGKWWIVLPLLVALIYMAALVDRTELRIFLFFFLSLLLSDALFTIRTGHT